MDFGKKIFKTFEFENATIKKCVSPAFYTEYEYSEKGSKSHSVEDDGSESWAEYDEHGNPVIENLETGQNILYQYSYDNEGRVIHSKRFHYSKKGVLDYVGENFYKYNEAGKLLYQYEIQGRSEDISEYEYDENGKLKKETYFNVVS